MQPEASSHLQHQQAGARFGPLGFAVITFSDSRNEQTDASGRLIRDAVAAAGHRVARYTIISDDPAGIRAQLEAALDDPAVAVVVTNGGTGISARDNAYDVIVPLLEKRLDGFGELFRMLSFEEVGAAAMLSRAVGGVARGKVLFALPGSTKAVRLGIERLILPEAPHLAFEIARHAGR